MEEDKQIVVYYRVSTKKQGESGILTEVAQPNVFQPPLRLRDDQLLGFCLSSFQYTGEVRPLA